MICLSLPLLHEGDCFSDGQDIEDYVDCVTMSGTDVKMDDGRWAMVMAMR